MKDCHRDGRNREQADTLPLQPSVQLFMLKTIPESTGPGLVPSIFNIDGPPGVLTSIVQGLTVAKRLCTSFNPNDFLPPVNVGQVCPTFTLGDCVENPY